MAKRLHAPTVVFALVFVVVGLVALVTSDLGSTSPRGLPMGLVGMGAIACGGLLLASTIIRARRSG